MFSTIDRVFPSTLFHQGIIYDQEHSAESGVLEISSSGNVVHAFIGGVRVSSDVTRIKIRNIFYQDCDFGYRQWT